MRQHTSKAKNSLGKASSTAKNAWTPEPYQEQSSKYELALASVKRSSLPGRPLCIRHNTKPRIPSEPREVTPERGNTEGHERGLQDLRGWSRVWRWETDDLSHVVGVMLRSCDTMQESQVCRAGQSRWESDIAPMPVTTEDPRYQSCQVSR